MAAVKKYKNSSQTRNKYWESKRQKSVKMDLLVISMNKSGNLRISKPCEKCVKFLYNDPIIHIKNVYYSDRDGSIVREKFSDLYAFYYL